MSKLIEQLKKILEVDSIDTKKKLTEFEEWDSLSSLSVLAMLDSDFGLTLTNNDLRNFENIESLVSYIDEHKKK
jgi:acyl carrier protein